MEDRGRSRTNVCGLGGNTLVTFLQLFNLQVIDTKYHAAAEENVVKKRRTEPVRGEIYDRNGEKIAYNIVAYDLEIHMLPQRRTYCEGIGKSTRNANGGGQIKTRKLH